MAHNRQLRPALRALLYLLRGASQISGNAARPGAAGGGRLRGDVPSYGTPALFLHHGGDPILHSRFWDILALLQERNIPFTILGNPFHLTDEVCRRLKEYGCDKYQLSIDGMCETHDAIRKSGSFDTTVEKSPSFAGQVSAAP